jgi:uncharacterized membrane protein YphA (DoxX/SURF4 family)
LSLFPLHLRDYAICRGHEFAKQLIFRHQQIESQYQRILLMKNLAPAVLIILWAYTGFDKILRFKESRNAFHNQTFPPELAELLSYSVPGVELLLVLLLLIPVARWWGYLGSALLLTVFITYVGLIWVGAFPRVPCNCAGIIDSMGWAVHFWMNLGLIGISVFGIWVEREKSVESVN